MVVYKIYIKFNCLDRKEIIEFDKIFWFENKVWFFCLGLINDKVNEICGIYYKNEMDGDIYEIWLVMFDNWYYFLWFNWILMG